MKKRLLPMFLVMMLFFSGTVYGEGFESRAGAAALMESSTGQFLYLKNGDEQRQPASITKIMTLLLVFEALERGDLQWDDQVTISERAWRLGGSKMWLPINEQVPVKDIIYGISIVSANDGCIAMAEHLSGSEEAFVQKMNQRAQELGLTNTQFKNSTGLPADGHVMSARDIAVLSHRLITQFPKILEIESMQEFTFNGIKQYNRNPLLGRFPGADGLKTGWTTESAYSLAGTALQEGRRLISVVLNSESENERLVASEELLNHGFRDFREVKAVAEGAQLGEVNVKNGRKQRVNITVAQDMTVTVPFGRENEIALVVTQGDAVVAPVTAGTQVGTLLVQLDGETLTSGPLILTEDVGRANIIVRAFRGLIGFFRGLIGR